jgi:hypothetical protein
MTGNFRLLIFGLALLEPIDLTNVNRWSPESFGLLPDEIK